MYDLEKFAIEQVNSGLQNQKENLRHMRAQGAVVGTLSVLLATFLVGKDTTADVSLIGMTRPNSLSDWIALSLMTISVCCSLYVVLLQAKWKFFISPNRILNELKQEDGHDDQEVLSICAYILDIYFLENEEHIQVLNSALFFAVVSAIGQVPFWVLF